MRNVSLEMIQRFHQQIAALERAGIPVHVIPNDQSALRFCSLRERGFPLEDVAVQETGMPKRYWYALERWLESEDMPSSLELLTLEPVALQEARVSGRLAWIQPLILLLLASLSFYYAFYFVLPKYEMMYEQVRQVPGPWLSALLTLRSWLPVWAPVFACLGLIVVGTSLYSSLQSSRRRFPGVTHIASRLLESMKGRGVSETEDAESANEQVSRAIATNVYRQSLQREQFGLRRVLPKTMSIVIGGTLVFASGLITLVPFVELLISIASSAIREG